MAYIYFTKSAHSSIVDASVDTPKEDISVNINGENTIIKQELVSHELFDAESDFQEEEVTLTLKEPLEAGSTIKVRIPHPYKINLSVLTDTGAASEVILNEVKTSLNQVRPLCDYVILKTAEIKTFEISGTVYINEDAEEEKCKSLVNEVLKDYITAIKNSLNVSVVLNKIISAICSIEGVYDFVPSSPAKNLDACKTIAYHGNIGTLKFVRKEGE